MNHKKTLAVLIAIILLGIGFLVGVLCTHYLPLWEKDSNNCLSQGYYSYAGLWTSNRCDFQGEWIHVRIDNQDYERALEVCAHEVGHEMFAEECEQNASLCFETIEKLKEEGK